VDMKQEKRLEALRKFRRGEHDCLIATDVAARGLDIDTVTHVINYDIPLEVDSYIHRIGRTGRAGKNGIAITFVTSNEVEFLHKIEERIGFKISPKAVPCPLQYTDGFPGVVKTKVRVNPNTLEKLAENTDCGITRLHINAGRKNKLRVGDIVGAITKGANISGESIGVIEIYDAYSFVDILNGYGDTVMTALKDSGIKGKRMKIEKAKQL